MNVTGCLGISKLAFQVFSTLDELKVCLYEFCFGFVQKLKRNARKQFLAIRFYATKIAEAKKTLIERNVLTQDGKLTKNNETDGD